MSAAVITDAATLLQALAAQHEAGAHLRLDSRAVQPGDVFVAVAGHSQHGRDFVAQAIGSGASAVLIDAAPSPPTPLPPAGEGCLAAPLAFPSPAGGRGCPEGTGEGQPSIPVFSVANLRGLLGEFGHRWYGAPSDAVTIIAVTGTNGKTSCVQWLAAALNAGGVRCGVIGTLGLAFEGDGLGDNTQTGSLTTPDVLTLHRTLAQWRDAGAQAVALEASSIGIEQGRLNGVRIAIAAYTNLSHDHLDYHGDMAAYAAAKARLFDWPGLKAAVVNVDDEVAARVLTHIPQVPRRIGFSLHADSSAAVRAVNLREEGAGLSFTLATPTGQADVVTTLIGRHNAENLLLVAGVLQALGWPLDYIAAALGGVKPVNGRLETVDAADVAAPDAQLPRVIVDYAHTPDALARALAALRPVANARGGRLICVFGCGGERDAAKRPVMGRIAADAADAVVVTSDNPRGEDARVIIDQIVAGVSGPTLSPSPSPASGRGEDRPVADHNACPETAQDATEISIIPDRAHAILRAVWSAAPEDVVLIAGKGHETYQDIAGQKLPFDDRQWARAALALLPVPCVSTDTRAINPGDVFLALSGERYDGHDYLMQAHAAGARAAIVARRIGGVNSGDAGIAQIVLGETRAALARLAAAWRAQMDTQTRLPLIAVTGSNGKTTTKEMIAAILAAWVGADARLASPGNFNNDVGVPLALLQLRPAHRVAVVELGMNHPGEIAALAGIAAPTVALVNNAQREHLEFMQTVQAVARENGSVLETLPADGVAVYPADDDYTALWDTLGAAHTRLRFGQKGEVTATDVTDDTTHSRCRVHTPQGDGLLALPLPGRHNLHNALAAIACTLAVGAPLAVALDALANFSAVKGRMQRIALPDGATLIDDSYNANPDSVRAAIDVLAQLPAPRALVLGDMAEVGASGPALHAEVGAYARARGIEHLYTMGEAGVYVREGYGEKAHGFTDLHELAIALADLRPASVLIKGSRAMRMERVVNAYVAAYPENIKTTGAAHAA